MYVVITYDVSVVRVEKVCAYLKSKLFWVLNSVFEGELTEAQLLEIKLELKKLIDQSKDSIRIYIINNKKNVKVECIGEESREISNII